MPYRTFSLIKSYKSVFSPGYVLVYLIYFSFFLFNGPLEKVLPLLFKESGFSEGLYGVFLSLINVVHIVLPGFIGYLAQKYNSAKIAVAAVLLSLLGAFCAGFFPAKYILLIPCALMVVCGRTVFNYSLGNSINYALPEENRGKYFALRDLFLFGAIALGLFVGGLYTTRYSVRSLYLLLSVGFMLPLILIVLTEKKVTLSNAKEEAESVQTRKREALVEILRDKKVWAYILIQVGTIVYSSAMNFLPLLGTSLGISVSGIMTMFGALTIVNSAVALIIGHFSDLAGRKWLVVFDLAFDILPAVVFAFTHNVTLFIVGIVLTMVKDAFAPSTFAYFFDCFPKEKGVLIMGVLSSLGNALSFVAPVIVGLLWAVSAKWVFLVGALGNGLAALVAIVMLPDLKVHDKETKAIAG